MRQIKSDVPTDGAARTRATPANEAARVDWRRSWQQWVRVALGVSCDGCQERLGIGEMGPLCAICNSAADPIGVWGQGPGGLPLLAAWRYGGPVASAIVGAKFQGRPLHAGGWVSDLASGLARRIAPGDTLVAIAPHLGRLRQRGHHLPDALAKAIQLGLARGARPRIETGILRRTDDAGPRSSDATAWPHFEARRGGGAVWLVDDVITTGRTLSEATQALRLSGVTVRGALCMADARPGRA